MTFTYKAGVGYAERFKVAGKPYLRRGAFLSGSEPNTQQLVEFPSITKSICVTNENLNTGSFVLRFSYAPVSDPEVSGALGTGSSIVLAAGETVEIPGRSKRCYISTDGYLKSACYYFITAELTGIVSNYTLSGEGIDE